MCVCIFFKLCASLSACVLIGCMIACLYMGVDMSVCVCLFCLVSFCVCACVFECVRVCVHA